MVVWMRMFSIGLGIWMLGSLLGGSVWEKFMRCTIRKEMCLTSDSLVSDSFMHLEM